MSDNITHQSSLKALIAKGKEQNYLTYAEVNDHLPETISDPDQVEDIIQMIDDMGIKVYETAPDADQLALIENNDATDELAAAEAAAALAAVENEAGRTTDPVRMYMREMGTVELLTRTGEIAIAKRIEERLRGATLSFSTMMPEKTATKVLVRQGNTQVEIEVTPVLRGCVFEPEQRTVSRVVEAAFGFAEMRVVSFADLYAGKLVAALDRQHPRDLFDVRDLLANEGIGDELRTAFIVYLLSHNRPMAEILAPAGNR